jgi:hypothetical protein
LEITRTLGTGFVQKDKKRVNDLKPLTRFVSTEFVDPCPRKSTCHFAPQSLKSV